MSTLKEVVDVVSASLLTNRYINTVTFGDEKEVDISKSTDFALSHIVPLPIQYLDGFSLYSLDVYAVNVYNSSRDDKVEVMSEMASVLEQLSRSLQRGQLFSALIRVKGTPTSTPVYDQFQNRLYGYKLTVAIQVPDGIDICIG